MSLILDALHRSDQERNNSNTVPGLQSQHGESAISDSGPRMLLLGLAVMLLAMLLLWVRVSGSPEVPASGSVTSISAETPAAGTPAADVIQRESAPATPREPGLVPAPSGNPGRAAPTATETVPPAVSKVETPAALESAKPDHPELDSVLPDGVAELYQRAAMPAARPSTTPVAPANEPLPVDAIIAAAGRELAAPPRDDDPTPLVQELPQRTRDEIPSIFFSRHSWSSKASEKLVTLNGEVHREGDAVVPGVRLIEILPESIVLDFQGTRFRLRALNSWVNL